MRSVVSRNHLVASRLPALAALVTLADTYEKATGATNIEWVASIGSLQADATREFARAYTSSVRELVS